MSDGSRITLTGADLSAVTADAQTAAASLELAAPSLASTIPAHAFGAYGTGVAAVGNALGQALGDAFTRLARLVRETGDGADRVRGAFEQVESDGAAAFRALRGWIE